MNILVINAGSSSFKYQLINMDTKAPLCSGLVERIGEPMGALVYKAYPDTDKENKIKLDKPFNTHREGMLEVIEMITSKEIGVVANVEEIYAAGHRVLLGGSLGDVVVTPEVKQIIKDFIPLGPLHNPANLAGIEVLEELFPKLPSVAVFDTGFHSTMEEHVYTYAIPKELSEKYKIRRYGFHGTSHKYVSREAVKFLGKDVNNSKVIVCHLGNGCSISAVKNGKCVDTSMGLTPLEGLIMGTRSGDLDPAILPFLMKNENLSPDEVDTLLNKKSGLKGLCGTNDMRDVEAAVEKGDKDATLAYKMFIYRIRKYIGAYLYALNGADAIVFTGGIGENDSITREELTKDLSFFGIEIDKAKNDVRSGEPRIISTPNSKISLVILPTNEELEIALTTQSLLVK